MKNKSVYFTDQKYLSPYARRKFGMFLIGRIIKDFVSCVILAKEIK